MSAYDFDHNSEALTNPPPASPVAFQRPRDFSRNRFVYTVISSRAQGLSIGVNMNPDHQCNFNCLYCEVDRNRPAAIKRLDVPAMAAELREALGMVFSGRIRSQPQYAHLPPDLTELRHVTLSGDGEPTLCPNFAEAVGAVIHLRAQGDFPFFKLVLVSNSSGLDKPGVRLGLKLFGSRDEVWVKLDAGSREYFATVNRSQVPLYRVMGNIIVLGRQRPVVIQSLFPMIDGQEPAPEEIDHYVSRLQELKAAGAMISKVQVYSANRPVGNQRCSHLPLKTLFRIAKQVRSETGLPAEVF